MTDGLPPIHDLVRFWYGSKDVTLGACIQFRKTPLPILTLGWLRQAAPIIMTRGLSETALRHAVREKIPSNAQQSVLKGVELFVRFANLHKWTGHSSPASFYNLPNGKSVKTQIIGRYFSERTSSDWLVALQPRQDDAPNDEQFRMWRSTIHYEFGDTDDRVMIVDLSKSKVSQKRELREITEKKFPLLSKLELDERLDLVASCYQRATEIIPERPKPPVREDDDPSFPF